MRWVLCRISPSTETDRCSSSDLADWQSSFECSTALLRLLKFNISLHNYLLLQSVVHYAVTTLRNLLIHVEPVKAQARALDAVQALSPLLLRTNPKLLAQVADSLYFLLLGTKLKKRK